jgi:hypothetical protein
MHGASLPAPPPAAGLLMPPAWEASQSTMRVSRSWVSVGAPSKRARENASGARVWRSGTLVGGRGCVGDRGRTARVCPAAPAWPRCRSLFPCDAGRCKRRHSQPRNARVYLTPRGIGRSPTQAAHRPVHPRHRGEAPRRGGAQSHRQQSKAHRGRGLSSFPWRPSWGTSCALASHSSPGGALACACTPLLPSRVAWRSPWGTA